MNMMRIQCDMSNVYEVFMQLNLAMCCNGAFWINEYVINNIVHVSMEMKCTENDMVPTGIVTVHGNAREADMSDMG